MATSGPFTALIVHILDRGRRRDAPNDSRRRQCERRHVAVSADDKPPAEREKLREWHEHNRLWSRVEPSISRVSNNPNNGAPVGTNGGESQNLARPRNALPIGLVRKIVATLR